MKVSVIIPVRNCESTVEKTLQSILDQSHKNIEIIVIDGASTDNTMQTVKPYMSQIAVCKSEPDQGTSDAINKGFSHVSGEIFTSLNADDHFADPDVIQRAVAQFSKDPNLDFLFSSVKVEDPEGLVADRLYHSDPTQLNKWVSLHFPGAFFKRTSIALPFMDLNYKVANDYEFICRHVIALSRKVDVVPEISVIMHLGGMSGQPKNDMVNSLEKFRVRRQYFGLPIALKMAMVAVPVSLLRSSGFRPMRWYRKIRSMLGLRPDGSAPSTIR